MCWRVRCLVAVWPGWPDLPTGLPTPRGLPTPAGLPGGRDFSADRADIPRWHGNWLCQWLAANAARYDFHPYQPEPWHWEHA